MPLDIEQIKSKIAELHVAVEGNLPGYIGILKTIHTETKEQPELLYKLEDTEIATLVAGLGHHYKVEITIPKAKAKITTKQGNQMSEDDV